jgi:hypothetical protein
LAINPPGDIILGVANAADPSKYQTAADRLARMGGDAAGTSGAQAVSSSATAQPSLPTTPVAPQGLRSAPALPADRPLEQSRGKADALMQFEAFVLQSFIQSMLPKHANSVFGRGTAGEVWKSMMAEMLANELAQSGRVGIAGQIAAGTAGVPENRSEPAPAARSGDLIRPTVSLENYLPYLNLPSVGTPETGIDTSIGSRSPTERS